MEKARRAHTPVLQNLHDFYRELQNDGILFCYSGPATQALVEGIGELLKKSLPAEDVGMTTTRNIFAIFIEQIQNIIHYSAEIVKDGGSSGTDGEIRQGVIVGGREQNEDKRFFVMCGNYVERYKGRILAEKIEAMRSLNREELKALYKIQRRRAPTTEDSKGAGLGFLEMARKASRPPDYCITEIDDRYSFFSLKVVG
jgi:hypothetical protein